jgi:ribosomal protein S12 methylthiotransferase accessory factor
MDHIYQFKFHLRHVSIHGLGVFVIGEREHYLLAGDLYTQLCPLIDGRRTVRELVAALAGTLSPPEVLYGVHRLLEGGYLAEVAPTVSPASAAFWHSLGVEPAVAAHNLARCPVTVETFGDLEPAPLIEALQSMGVSVQEQAPIRVIVVEDYLTPALEDINHRALEQQHTWMLVKPQGLVSLIGPMFQAGEGPCWACLAHRLRSNRPVETFLQRWTDPTVVVTPPWPSVPASVQTAINLAALSLARWLAQGGQGPLDRTVFTLDHSTLQVHEHVVVQRPQCSVCGNPQLVHTQGWQSVILTSRLKTFTTDGGHRCLSPQETYDRYRHHVSAVTGIISSLGPVPTRDHPLRPVYGANYLVCPLRQAPSFDDFHQTSLGKGQTLPQARTSALCEAIERWSAVFQGDEPRIRTSFAQLHDAAIHPNALMQFSATQYHQRERWNRAMTDRRQAIPLPFDERAMLDWTPLWSLTAQHHRYVPTSYCYANVPVAPAEQFCFFNSNGHAAGNCLEEAIVQAFFELVERDAVALWWYNRLRRPAVELASFGEPYFLLLHEHYRAMGWWLWVLDVTTDLDIPTFVALAHSRDARRFCIGFGCHFDVRLGVKRALTELNQLFDPQGHQAAPWDVDAIADSQYLFPDTTRPARVYTDFTEVQHVDVCDDIATCVQRAQQVNLEVLVLNQTRPDVGLAVAMVAVPGLRHFWPRFGPGRLYEVPVALGWLAQPLHEQQLNPVAIFL